MISKLNGFYFDVLKKEVTMWSEIQPPRKN